MTEVEMVEDRGTVPAGALAVLLAQRHGGDQEQQATDEEDWKELLAAGSSRPMPSGTHTFWLEEH